MVFQRRLLVLLAAATNLRDSDGQQGKAPTMTIVGPGSSASNPTYGASASILATGEAPWVRLDRTDGVAETGTGPDGDNSGRGWMTVADESVTFQGAVVFPVWLQPQWGVFKVFFGGSDNNQTVDLVASGWSDDGPNGTRLTPNSSALTIHYSTACRQAKAKLNVESLGPGTVRLSTENDKSDTLAVTCPITQAAFYSYAPNNGSFKYLYNLRVEADRNFSYVLNWRRSGIYFWGAAPSSHGRMMQLTAGGEYNTEPATHPTAIAVADAGGAVNATLPDGFSGDVVHITPLPAGQNYSGFCLTLTNLTVFSGVAVNFPFCEPNPLVEIQQQMEFVSVVLPSWLHVFPVSNRSSAQYYVPTVNRTVTLSSGDVLTTFRSYKGGKRWWIYNTHVTLSFTFAPEHAGKTAAAKLLLHDNLEDADGGNSPLFTNAEVLCVLTPEVTLPERFITSITWANPEMLFEGSSPDGEFAFLDTYRKLGFNTVPSTGDAGRGREQAGMIDSPWAYVGNRSADPGWQGLKFGPELSGFTHSLYARPPLYKSGRPNATLVGQMLAQQGSDTSSANIAEELRKWKDAQAFENATNRIDFAYDGVWYQQDINAFCSTMLTTKPELVFVDDEGLGSYSTWKLNVGQSKNALKRRHDGESLDSLAWRMTDAMLAQWSRCLSSKKEFPNGPPRIFFYGMGPAPDALMNKNGFTGTPSPYGPEHHLTMYPAWLKVQKQQMVQSGKGRQFLPWITGGTYGEMTPVAVLDGVLHSFGSGGTGFAFFSAADFDDGGKILALSSATALAAPFENIFFEGNALNSAADVNESLSQNVLAWSGMRYEHEDSISLWMVVTPAMLGERTTLHLTTKGLPSTACDLVKGTSLKLSKGNSDDKHEDLVYSDVLRGSVVLHIAKDAEQGPGCAKSQPLAKNMWWPQ